MGTNQPERYSLFTAITMIVGICIGSGIFFKADNVLMATNGSIFLGIILFILGAIAITFGGLTVAELASRTNKPGGIITYSEEFVGMGYASAFGWFHTLVYYPALTFVVSFVIGIYTSTLFGWQMGVGGWCLIGVAFSSLCFLYNTLSPKFGGFFQDATCIIKVIPLIILAFCGLVWGDPASGFSNLAAQTQHSGKWIMGISAVAFSYDGWIISTSIAHEIKDSKKNLPRALIIAPIIVLLLYLSYFISVSTFLGSATILEVGDNAVYLMAEHFLGSVFSKLILVFVIISVMGTVNGIVLGGIRLPYGLALRGSALPRASWFRQINEKLDMPVNSAIFMYIITMVWGLIHYLTCNYGLLGNSDVSEIAICASYILYLTFYWKVYKLWRKGEIKSFFRGVICPILATIGVGLVVYGSLIGGYLYVVYLGISAVVFALGMLYYRRHADQSAA
jgi:APA family basic amino acid/polyamine antiporter